MGSPAQAGLGAMPMPPRTLRSAPSRWALLAWGGLRGLAKEMEETDLDKNELKNSGLSQGWEKGP